MGKERERERERGRERQAAGGPTASDDLVHKTKSESSSLNNQPRLKNYQLYLMHRKG